MFEVSRAGDSAGGRVRVPVRVEVLDHDPRHVRPELLLDPPGGLLHIDDGAGLGPARRGLLILIRRLLRLRVAVFQINELRDKY
ncbi:hypothetical protein KGM_201214 [Danaus plexippus plexippus]|uniref:Uncharacterized protein n=1 Tax=Danaus plexippus plexippus TaxID=278856 RepID=A0A212FNN5_DANPL|nr:hypothetical protein KGM_201214 [Danaus plexippus plexippus]